MSKLYYQYLPAAFRANTLETNLRVWSALGAYLTTPATSRKLFVLSVQEATAAVQSVRELTDILRCKEKRGGLAAPLLYQRKAIGT